MQRKQESESIKTTVPEYAGEQARDPSPICLFAFGLNQEVIQDELFGPIRGLACLVFAAAAAAGGRGCNHSSRGGGP